jgi:C4-dicarboxylate-specific signal transduction histidine kinase
VLLLQTALISWLVYEHWRRQIAEGEALQRAIELARMNRFATAGEMSASIAHEIRQPLAAIASFGSAALNWLNRAVPDVEEVRSSLRAIVDASHRADDVVKSIRTMFERQEGLRSRVNLNDLVRQVIVLLTRQINENNIALELVLADDPPPVTMADPVQLQQVILNLVMNAIEAIASTDHSERVLHVQTRAEGGSVFLAVVDSGPGFDPKLTEKPFTPFVTTKPNGMGMGLAICKSIIERHEGRLAITAREPRGVVVQVALRRAP